MVSMIRAIEEMKKKRRAKRKKEEDKNSQNGDDRTSSEGGYQVKVDGTDPTDHGDDDGGARIGESKSTNLDRTPNSVGQKVWVNFPHNYHHERSGVVVRSDNRGEYHHVEFTSRSRAGKVKKDIAIFHGSDLERISEDFSPGDFFKKNKSENRWKVHSDAPAGFKRWVAHRVQVARTGREEHGEDQICSASHRREYNAMSGHQDSDVLDRHNFRKHLKKFADLNGLRTSTAGNNGGFVVHGVRTPAHDRSVVHGGKVLSETFQIRKIRPRNLYRL